MTLSDDEISERLRTRILNFHRDHKEPIIEVRQDRIDEAVAWDAGPSTAKPMKHVVETLPEGHEVHFLKPGKEADRSDPNPDDMTPNVGDLYTNYRFDDTWSEIARIGFVNEGMFRFFMVLLYRNAYLIDHEDIGGGRYRYRPDPQVMKTLNDEVGDAITGTVRTFLHFLDILGWNEDVKYHGPNGDYELSSSFYTGRINTILSCIDIPYKLSHFIEEVTLKADRPEDIDVRMVLETMQDLSSARGVSRPTQGELEGWFSPVLHS